MAGSRWWSTSPANVDWNFEKFVVAADGKVLGRFTPKTQPDDPAIVAVIEAALP